MSVFDIVRREIPSGTFLLTPVKRCRFRIEYEKDKVVFFRDSNEKSFSKTPSAREWYIMDKPERFKYNMNLEMAMCNLLGKTYYGYAGGFSSPKLCKRVLLRAIKKIRKRIEEIAPVDERLLLTTGIGLDQMERDVKGTSLKVNNDWLIIGDLLHLVSFLLGYDWCDGKVNRQVFFHQDKDQEIKDERQRIGKKFWDEFPGGDWKIRCEIIYVLKKRNLSINQIARTINLSDRLVAKILKRIDSSEKETGKEFSQELDKLDFRFFSA